MRWRSWPRSARRACATTTSRRQALSKARTVAAARLGKDVSALMAELGMAGGRFAVELEPQSDSEPDAQGRERCEFTGQRQSRQAAAAIAQGRLRRRAVAHRAGDRGRRARARTPSAPWCSTRSIPASAAPWPKSSAQKLRALGAQRQVLCVTHLPQVAAQGHAHLHVSASTAMAESPARNIDELDDSGRREELARMLGGVEITAKRGRMPSRCWNARRLPDRERRKKAARRSSRHRLRRDSLPDLFFLLRPHVQHQASGRSGRAVSRAAISRCSRSISSLMNSTTLPVSTSIMWSWCLPRSIS